MPKDDWTKVDKAFEFLLQRAEDGNSFSMTELAEAAGWKPSYMSTNAGKHMKEFVQRKGRAYCASPEIFKVRRDDFRDLFRQSRRLFARYQLKKTRNVLVYEFFMPLTREARLREALDNLFYREPLEHRIREIGYQPIRDKLDLQDCTEDEVRHAVIKFIEDTIGGYSVYHVSGRFRMANLASRKEVSERRFADGPYLIDETTAVVRFILPVDTGEEVLTQGMLFEPLSEVADTPGRPLPTPGSVAERAEQISWVFQNFFAEAVIRVVKGEDEIWLLETGMKNALYRWTRCEEQ